ncbi:hypothetical protein J6590_046891 [Homalodisca vitripennis]|nr:hypothetical protein J6590_046891 [Homalodisca vitripennis]
MFRRCFVSSDTDIRVQQISAVTVLQSTQLKIVHFTLCSKLKKEEETIILYIIVKYGWRILVSLKKILCPSIRGRVKNVRRSTRLSLCMAFVTPGLTTGIV